MAHKLPGIVESLNVQPWTGPAQEAIRRGAVVRHRVIRDSEVGDHHAIIPTGKVPSLSRLSASERSVFELIVQRFLAAFLPDAVFARTHIETTVAGHLFVSDGRVRLDAGWQLAEPPPKKALRQTQLPAVQEGMPVDTLSADVHQGKTTPPNRYTEASLLTAMERCGGDIEEEELRRELKECGLGTPATRASIIETLLSRDYIRRERKNLVPLPRGRALVNMLPVDELLSAELTGRWEGRLAGIANGQGDRASFMREIGDYTRKTMAAIHDATPPPEIMAEATEAEILGRCPVCGSEVKEGFRAYTCESGKSCTFVIYKKIARRKISKALVKVLLDRRRSQVLRGFRSKKGKPFSATLVLQDDGTVSFEFEGDKRSRPYFRNRDHHVVFAVQPNGQPALIRH